MRRPSPGTALGLISLFVSLGGTSYAAVKVTGKTVVNSSLTGADIRNESIGTRDVKGLKISDFAKGQAPAAGAKGEPGERGTAGAKGDTGPAGGFTEQLPSGKTVRGNFAARDLNESAATAANDPISFGFTLASAPAAHYLPTGAPATSECPGSPADPKAAPGHLCAYEANGNGARGLINTVTGAEDRANRWGMAVYVLASNDAYANGTWAVTAP